MDRSDLDLVVSIARTGSVTAAAEALSVAQPAASRRLRQLERSVGTVLFTRGRHGARMTPAGALLAERASRILDSWIDLERDLAGAAAGQLGTVRIGTLPTLGSDVLPTALATLRRDHPEVLLALHTSGDPAQLLDDVANGHADVAVVALPGRLPRELRVAHEGRQHFVVVLPADHRLAARATISRKALIGEPAVSVPSPEGLRQVLDDLFVGLTGPLNGPINGPVARPTIAIETPERELLLPLVIAGLGYALVPAVFAAQRAGTGVVVRPIRPQVSRPVGVVVRRGSTGALIDAALNAMADLQW